MATMARGVAIPLDMKRAGCWTARPAPRRSLVSSVDARLEPIQYLLLYPSDPGPRPVPKSHALWKLTNVLEPLNMSRTVENQLLQLLLR